MNPGEFNKFLRVADFSQSVGAFIQDGVFNTKTVYNHEGVWIIAAWDKMEPVVRGIRKLPEYMRALSPTLITSLESASEWSRREWKD